MSNKSFRDMTPRIMPDREMLADMERDLSFVPGDPNGARTRALGPPPFPNATAVAPP